MRILELVVVSALFQAGAWLVVSVIHPVEYLTVGWWGYAVGILFIAFVVNAIYGAVRWPSKTP